MITYAGVPLNLPTREMVEWIEKTVPLKQLFSNVRPPNNSRWDYHYHRDIDSPKLGCLYWPSGATRFAHGVFVASKNRMDLLRTSFGDTFNNPIARNLQLWGGNTNPSTARRLLTVPLYLLPPIPIQVNGPDNRLYLLPLVDRRYFLQKLGINQDVFDGENSYQTSLTGSWLTFLTNQCGSPPGAGTAVATLPEDFSVSDDFLQPDPSLKPRPFNGDTLVRNRMAVLDSIALNCQFGIVANYTGDANLKGVLTFQHWDQAASKHASNMELGIPRISGWDVGSSELFPESGSLALPQTIQFVFPQVSSFTGWYAGNDFRLSPSLPFQGQGNVTWTIFETAKYDTRNQARLAALASRWCNSLVTRLKHCFEITWSGIAVPDECALYDQIEWHHREGECYTRVRSVPPNLDGWQLSHQDGTVPDPLDRIQELRTGSPVPQCDPHNGDCGDGGGGLLLTDNDPRRLGFQQGTGNSFAKGIYCTHIGIPIDRTVTVYWDIPTQTWRVIAASCP